MCRWQCSLSIKVCRCARGDVAFGSKFVGRLPFVVSAVDMSDREAAKQARAEHQELVALNKVLKRQQRAAIGAVMTACKADHWVSLQFQNVAQGNKMKTKGAGHANCCELQSDSRLQDLRGIGREWLIRLVLGFLRRSLR